VAALARTGEPDPVAARALVQQVIRMSSRLSTVCPSRPLLGWVPFDRARAARVAALQTIRDGLLDAADLAVLLPQDTSRLRAGALLALVDRAALQCTANVPTERTVDRTGTRTGTRTGSATSAPDGDRTSAPEPVQPSRPANPASSSGGSGRAGRDERTDDELVLALHRHAQAHNDGRPLSQREVMRVLGVGTPKAKRLAVRAGWAEPAPSAAEPSDTDRPAPSGEPPEPLEQVPGQLALVAQDAADHDSDYDGDSADAEEIHARNSR
jgi:hypothetical protein